MKTLKAITCCLFLATAVPAHAQLPLVTLIQSGATYAWQSTKEHYLVTSSVALIAVITALYSYNQTFKNRARKTLGFKDDQVKKPVDGLEELECCAPDQTANYTRAIQKRPLLIINRKNVLAPTATQESSEQK